MLFLIMNSATSRFESLLLAATGLLFTFPFVLLGSLEGLADFPFWRYIDTHFFVLGEIWVTYTRRNVFISLTNIAISIVVIAMFIREVKEALSYATFRLSFSLITNALCQITLCSCGSGILPSWWLSLQQAQCYMVILLSLMMNAPATHWPKDSQVGNLFRSTWIHITRYVLHALLPGRGQVVKSSSDIFLLKT